jgi:hypothetical protein
MVASLFKSALIVASLSGVAASTPQLTPQQIAW